MMVFFLECDEAQEMKSRIQDIKLIVPTFFVKTSKPGNSL